MILLSEAIKASGVKMTVKSGVHSRIALNDWQKKVDSWTVVLHYKGRQMTQAYFMGKGHKGVAPTVSDVLASLVSDSHSFDSYLSVKGFASEFGYDDLKEAEKVYNACGKSKKNLYRVLGKEVFDSLYNAEDDM